jgi:hypothetical protein
MTDKGWLIGVRERATLFVILSEAKNLLFLYLFKKTSKRRSFFQDEKENKGDE